MQYTTTPAKTEVEQFTVDINSASFRQLFLIGLYDAKHINAPNPVPRLKFV